MPKRKKPIEFRNTHTHQCRLRRPRGPVRRPRNADGEVAAAAAPGGESGVGEGGLGERVGGGEDQRAPLGQGRWGGVEGGGRPGGGAVRAVETPCPALVGGAVSPSLEAGPWAGEGGAFEEQGAEHGSPAAAEMTGSAGHGARFFTGFCGGRYPLMLVGVT